MNMADAVATAPLMPSGWLCVGNTESYLGCSTWISAKPNGKQYRKVLRIIGTKTKITRLVLSRFDEQMAHEA